MNFLDNVFYSKDKNKIYLIGVLHLVMVCFGIWSLVFEMINLEEPVTSYEVLYISIHYTVHFILILCLFIGAYIDIPFFLIPWLSAAFLIYFYITMLTLISLDHLAVYNFILHLVNVAYLGICWYTWYIVFSYIKKTYHRAKRVDKYLFE